MPFQIFGQEPGDFFEAGNIFRTEAHQGAMCFQTVESDLFLGRLTDDRDGGFSWEGTGVSSRETLKRRKTPMVSSNSIMRGFGLSNSMALREFSVLAPFIFSANPASTPRKVLSISRHSESSNRKWSIVSSEQFVEERFEINAGGEIGPSDDFHAGRFFFCQHG